MPRNLSQTTLAGRYRFDELIGEGTFARVYRVHDLKRNVDLAAKVLRQDIAEDATLLERFRREAGFLERLQHPNIVRFYEIVEAEGVFFILLDYIPSDTLQNYLYKVGEPLSVHHALQFIRPLTAALTYAHGEGILHRDIKPANILLGNGGGVYITDFGIARILNDSSTLTVDSAVGSPLYIAPEQWQGKPLTLAADVYSVGILLYLMLTGVPPFKGDSAQAQGATLVERVAYEHIHIPPPAPRQQQRSLSEAGQAVILRCLMKEPTARYPSALAIYEALAESIGATPSDLAPVAIGDGKAVPPNRTLPEWSKVVPKVGQEASPVPQPDLSRFAPTTPHLPSVDDITLVAASQAEIPPSQVTVQHIPTYEPVPTVANTPVIAGPSWANLPPPAEFRPVMFSPSQPPPPPTRDLRGCILMGGIASLVLIVGVFCIAMILVTLSTFGEDDSILSTASPEVVQPDPSATQHNMEAITPVSSPSASPSPSSTPSNERIFAYSQLQNGQLDLYEMNVTTGAIRQLSSSNISEAGPSYSPDGSQIAYYAYGSEDDPAELWIMNADGSEPRQLTNDPFDQRVVAWSPDGRYLAYHAETTRNGYEIFLYDLSNDTSRAVSQHPANDLAPAWSPDGSQLAFHSDEWNDNFDLYIIASDGSNRRRLTNGDSRYAFAAWSSQGQIVFHAILGSNTYRLQVIQPDGTGIQTLLEGQNQRHADWSSDGQALLYMAGDLNAPLIMLTTVGSAEGQVVAENGYFPDWQP
jgi:serine/threonine protein kinase